jgi:hypothetical protein
MHKAPKNTTWWLKVGLVVLTLPTSPLVYSQSSTYSMTAVKIEYRETTTVECPNHTSRTVSEGQKTFGMDGTHWRETGTDNECGVWSPYTFIGDDNGKITYRKKLRQTSVCHSWNLPAPLEEGHFDLLSNVQRGDEIVGFQCKKAILQDQTAKWEIQFTEALSAANFPDGFWGKANGVPGLILERKRLPNVSEGELLTHYIVTDIDEAPIDPEYFEIPSTCLAFPNRVALAESNRNVAFKGKTPSVRTWTLKTEDFKTQIKLHKKEGALIAEKTETALNDCGASSSVTFTATWISNSLLLWNENTAEVYQFDLPSKALIRQDGYKPYRMN